MTGRIVILNGAPRSGKSCIARAYDVNAVIEIPGGLAGGAWRPERERRMQIR